MRDGARDPICSEVLFLDMGPGDGAVEFLRAYWPLVEYIVLEQAQVVVDMPGHRLIHNGKVDLKRT